MCLLSLRICGLILLSALAAFAQPANDLFVNAWTLEGLTVSTNGSTSLPVNATKEPGEPNHAGHPGGRSVWFNWTAPTNGTTRIATLGSSFNTLLAVYTGNVVNALTLVAANDNIGGGGLAGNSSRVEFFATAGTTYRIALDGRQNFGTFPASGAYVLNLQYLGLVQITSPANNEIFQHGSAVDLQVEAALLNPIARVDFYWYGSLIGTDTTPPYSIVFSNGIPSTNVFTAVATDTSGQSLTSEPINVLLLSEGITITAPLDGQGYLTTAPIAISAVAHSFSGSTLKITNIQFSVDGLPIGEDDTAPFTANWTTVTSGAHRITATGQDDAGVTFQAAPVWVTIAQRLVSSNSLWKYFDKGIDLGTAWREPAYDDSGWSNGVAELGYGDAEDGRPEATVVSFGPDPNNKYPTTYFRRAFEIPSANYSFLILYVQRDDGAVVYLNGTEAGRFNMPAGTITYNTFAQNAQDDGVPFFAALAATNLLVSGTNVLAVEVHQTNPNSSDLSFDLELVGLPVIPRNAPPLVAITSPPNNTALIAPAEITITATANDTEGSVAQVEFFADGLRIGAVTTPANPPEYSIIWSNPPVGWHTIYAVATDNEGAVAAAAPINVAIYDANGSPLIQITAPPDGTTVEGPTNILITAQASVPGVITNVEFYADNVLIGASTDSSGGLRADYQFQNTLASEIPGAPALVNLGPNTFTTASVNGRTAPVLRFAQNDGLSLAPASAIFSTNYTLVALFSFDNITSWRRIFDFSGGFSDFGLYFINGSLIFYPMTPLASASIIPNTFVQVALTRDATSAEAIGYVDGLPQFSFTDVSDYALTNFNDALRLFRDDGSEATSGNIARLRIYDRPLAPGEIASLDRLPAPAGGAASYSFLWRNPPFATNTITAVAYADSGTITTSAPIAVVVNEPPFNTNAPVIVAINPPPGATITQLTTISITFSEIVGNVDPWDLLINGQGAFFTGGTGSNYVFEVPQPLPGTVTITWDPSHSIHDFGYPSNLLFDHTAPGHTWTYQLVDRTRPTIGYIDPPPGSVLTNVSQISVGFSESVTNVDAADLLVNGQTAVNVIGSDGFYTFEFLRPTPGPGGLVNVTWASDHDITDLAQPPNAFNHTAPGHSWTYTIDTRTILVNSNGLWRFQKGTREASSPISAWRFPNYDDSSWSNALAPFFYGDPYSSFENPGTFLNDMQGSYSSIYLRSSFYLPDPAALTNLFIRSQSDDGYIAWLNGIEIVRYNMAPGDIPFSGVTLNSIQEPQNNGAAYLDFAIPNPSQYLIPGTNVLAVHAFNQNLSSSSDFGFNAQLYGYASDPSTIPPRIQTISPEPGELFYLTNITITFTEPVREVRAQDLLINGIPATNLITTTNTTYTFEFSQPEFGLVSITWSDGQEIVDFDSPPRFFDAHAPGASFQYNLVNPNAPTVAAQTPVARATVTNLTQINVTFTKPVSGVDAADLLVNGLPASSLSPLSPASFSFSFPQPAYGDVNISWDPAANIQDTEIPPNAFDPTRRNNIWSYTLVDQTPPRIASQNPPAGSLVINLSQLTLAFTEPVTGVNASDLLINGVPATGVSGTNATYTFTFSQPNSTVVNISWANLHGIRDLATLPNAFDHTAPGSTWAYTTPDNVPPSIAHLDPPAHVTVRSLSQIRVTFSEPVTGVSATDLLINSAPARSVTGSGAGPYTFAFLPPPNGSVEVRWAPGHGIYDLALTPNQFPGGEWTYTLDPDATFAGKIVINEIMFNPRTVAQVGSSRRDDREWLELHNISPAVINLAGWRFTRGIQFTFPNVSIPAGGYLVVAADPFAFQADHPAVPNFVGGWTGRLANSDETIELRTALDEQVDSVHYATEGDWARREAGHGAEPVISIVRNGATATVTIFGHGYSGSDQIAISGADQPEYNGRFSITSITPTTFNITVSGSPPSPATGNIIARHVIDNGLSGWSWFSAADGFGYSLELANPDMPNTSGQNWLPSANPNGTPGAPNSARTNNIPPLITEVVHFPPVPAPSDPVAITARVQDESGLEGQATASPTLRLFYRNHTTRPPGPFISTNMSDDGAHSDGLPNDGLYGAVLPAMPNGTIIEFYVEGVDTAGLVRTWPAPATDIDGNVGQFANALYQVSEPQPTDNVPVLRIVMTDTEDAIFPPGDRGTDAEMNVTMISTDANSGGAVRQDIRYLCGVRIRGAGSRTRQYPNNRLNIPNDNRWNDLAAVNLNGQFIHAQLMGGTVAQKSGLPASNVRLVRYFINGLNAAPPTAPNNGSGQGAGYSAFLLVDPVNGDLAADLFPEDGDGNVYRASTGNHNADLTYQGTNPASYLARGYMKTSNGTENDWSDLMSLTFAFSQVPNDPDYFQAMATNVNLHTWLRYFAVGTLVNFGETSMFNGRGDDYALYRGINDPRFVPIGHDFDTVFGQGDTTGTYTTSPGSSIFIMLNPPNSGGNAPNMPVLRRFLTNAVFAPLFFAEIKRLCDTVFHPSELNPLFDQLLSGWGPTTLTIDAMKNHAAARRASVLAQIPLTLTINHSLGSSGGFLFTTLPTAAFSGTSHAIDTRRVLVNGVQAAWSPWEGRWTHTAALRPGINHLVFQSMNSNDVEFARATLDVWYDDGGNQLVSGPISADTAWTAANGPYQVTADITVAPGATLTIQPGTTVYLDPGADITVANGGRLLAEGTDTARIRFMRTPASTGPWGGITINGGPSSPETRITYAHIEGNDSTAIRSLDATVFLDHLTFGTLTERYIDVDRSSFVISHCVFPTPTAQLEMVHGNGGIKQGGRGVFLRNFFGKPIGYNDTVDFTGGNRPQPIVHFINNVFLGSDDDILDLDSTDAWVEGNIFMHVHRNGNSPDSASAVSGGNDTGEPSEITMVGNIIYDCDHAALAKQGNFYTLIQNTIVRQTRLGGIDTDAAVVVLADDGTAEGAGFHLEGNVIHDAEKLVRNHVAALVTFTNNLMPLPWAGPGGNNSTEDPMLKYIPQLSETTSFTSWEEAQIMHDWFSLRTGSPARGTGPNGSDKGGVIPVGATISGVPAGVTSERSAILSVGFNRPAIGFPDGSGYTHFKWRLDGGPWSAETPIAAPISLSSLANGPHFVEVVGKRDSGMYQDDPSFGPDAVPTISRTWSVNSSTRPLRLNEILASNSGAVPHQGQTPDAIELINLGSSPVDLTGLRLTDDPTDPDKFIFTSGATLGTYLVVFSTDLGFGLSEAGDGLYLYDSVENGGALIDSIAFGPQLPDLSIGRLEDGQWALTQPTFGARNRAAPLGDPMRLRINEWLALGTTPFDNDFIELFNPGPLPVALGGLYLTDEVVGWPGRHQVAALSFLRGGGYFRFVADGDPTLGPEHLNFRLSAEQGAIGLFLPDLTAIDCVAYKAQELNVSQGRSPNGGSTIVFFTTPTPGGPNPIVTGPGPTGDALVINELLALNSTLVESGRTPDWVELYNGTTNIIDLSDMSLSDDPLEPRRYVFPAGVAIAPGTYLRVICDPESTNSGPLINTNFALKSSGGSVYLLASEANFGDVIDAIFYGIQTADLSIGRVPNATGSWTLTLPSPDAANIPVPALGNPANLKINEWLADPEPGDDDWFEVYNPDPMPVAIGGLFLTDDLNDRTKHQITPLSFIGAGTNAWQIFVADDNVGAGADHVAFALRAGGESLGISSLSGALINGHAFGRQTPGVSEGRFADGDATVVSFPGTASPGAANWRRLPGIVINEALTHTDEPLEDAIELLNLTDQPIDISGWWLSDDNGTLLKYQIPSPTIIPANGFTVIYENQFTNREIAAIPFALSSGGDEVVLSAAANGALTGYRVAVDFGNAANGVSFGRYITSDNREEFVAMEQHTFGVSDPGSVEEFRTGAGTANTYPRVGPVVISEIMYHPPDIGIEDNQRDEFIELRNTSTVDFDLFDALNPTNTWRLRDAVDFDFPPGTTLPAGGELLVVSFDPVNNPAALDAFRAAYNITSTNQLIFGPYEGRLANNSDDVELRRPDAPDGGDVRYILVERVRYSDTQPWPAAADGTGFSLHRLSETGFANDPTNFIAGAPSPGQQGVAIDFDGDGIPDDWENTYSLDPRDRSDAIQDLDNDGHSNLKEYQAGTLPNDPSSVLRLKISQNSTVGLQPGSEGVTLSFTAQPNKTYSLLWKESVESGTWTKLDDIDAAEILREITRVDPLPPSATRVYTLLTPRDPGPLNAAPAILTAPKSTHAPYEGEATFSVTAHSFAGAPMQYLWTRNGIPVPGADGPSLVISPARYTELGVYRVSVTDPTGTATTAPVFLSLPPRITVQPESRSARVGASVAFSVTAEGAGPLSYLWLRGRRPIAGATNATLTLTNIQTEDATNYSVVVFHELPWGKVSVASSNAVITIDTSRTLQYVVHVSLDGLGGPYLERYLDIGPTAFPNFLRLKNQGAYTFNARCDYDVSETIPNHACILTGRPVLQPAGEPDTTHHGYNNNFPPVTDTFHIAGNTNVPYKASFFDVAHDHGLSTALYLGKVRLGICDRSYDAVNGAPDLILPDHGQDKIDLGSVPLTDVRGAAISNEVNQLLANLNSPAPTNYSFIHIAEPDLTGHTAGWGTANWSNAVRLVDQQLGRIFAAIDSNPTLGGNTALIVTTDHGGGGVVPTGHTEAYHVYNYTIPFFLWAPGIPAGVDIYTILNNRQDPGTNRVDYSEDGQPLRSGDSGNLALALLGLPPIPGSYFQPQLIAPLATSAFAESRRVNHNHAHLHGAIDSVTGSSVGSELRLISIESLPDNRVLLTLAVPPDQGCTVLFSPDISGPEWSPIAAYPPEPAARVIELIAPAPPASGFYRLRSP